MVTFMAYRSVQSRNLALYSLDPTVPEFRKWLLHLGASEYTDRFLQAGYDLAFIAKSEITAEDLDVVGIPMSKLGIRRKIMRRYEIDLFYPLKAAAEKKTSGGGSGSGDDDDSNDDEDRDSDEDDDDDDD